MLVMTLLARNEADIVDAQIAFHLHAGVDLVIAIDNGSTDGTTEILERYERDGHLRLLHEPGDDMRQAEWVTQMARMAAELGATWVINSDADEFWWPRGGSLTEVLALVPARYGLIRGCWRHFLPRPPRDPFFAERMTVRLRSPAAPGDKRTIHHAHQKVAHRADPLVEVEAGNHNAFGVALEPLRTWHPIEVLHFSIRSREQLESKAHGGWSRNREEPLVEHQTRLDTTRQSGRFDDLFDEYVVSDAELEDGLTSGTYAIDTRLRDALRTLRGDDGSFLLPGQGVGLDFPMPDLEEAAAYAAEASILVSIDAIQRAERRVAGFEERLARLRTLPRR